MQLGTMIDAPMRICTLFVNANKRIVELGGEKRTFAGFMSCKGKHGDGPRSTTLRCKHVSGAEKVH